jgi:antitoxin (DNA-binding transcriptional repressor) of toxin-antitoxin stability system
MRKVVSIYEARTNLSKYIKKAEAGQIIYVGAYGRAQAIIAPVPVHIPLQIGVWARKKRLGSYEYDNLTTGSNGAGNELKNSSERRSLV